MPVSIVHHFRTVVSIPTTSSMQQPQLLGRRSMDLFGGHHMSANHKADHTLPIDRAQDVSV